MQETWRKLECPELELWLDKFWHVTSTEMDMIDCCASVNNVFED